MLRIHWMSTLCVVGLFLASCGGDGSSDDPPSPTEPVATVTISPDEVTLIAGSFRQLMAITRDGAGRVLQGRAVAWATSEPSVATVSADGDVAGISVGDAAITATSEGKSGTATVSVVAAVAFESVSTGGAHTCALTDSGMAFCWGRGESGQLGIPVPTTTCTTDAGPFPCSMVPVAVGGGFTFTQLAGGDAHTCGLTSDGSAYCWGNNSHGQLGDDSTTSRNEPAPVETTLKFARIDAGGEHTCALTDDNAAFCWGRNNRGQLGDGSTANRSTPVAVTGGHQFTLVVAGGFEDFAGHTCALTTGDDAYCWGDNERGQLGIGTGGFGNEDLASHPDPLPVSGALQFTVLTAGLGRHTCGLTVAGAAYCWGENSFGALGDGSATDRPEPVEVIGGIDFADLVAGGFIGHTCGWTADGTAYCWGENERGQVGDGSNLDRFEPSPVADGHTFTRIDAGLRHSCGKSSTGKVYCWGSNGAGQLGINSIDPSSVPEEVTGQQ